MTNPLSMPLLGSEQEARPTLHSATPPNAKIELVLKKGQCMALLEGLYNSRTVRCPFTAVAIGVAVALTLPVSGPALIAYITGSILLTVGLNLLVSNGKNKMKAEVASAFRLFQSKILGKENYNKISYTDKGGNIVETGIFLGILPNLHDSSFINKNEIGAILAINEEFELENRLFSFPITPTNVGGLTNYTPGEEPTGNYLHIEQRDHSPSRAEELDRGADFIHHSLARGNNIYIHCLAGKGRSAKFVAAYLIKHKRLDIGDAVDAVVSSRPVSTLNKTNKKGVQSKIEALRAFETYLDSL